MAYLIDITVEAKRDLNSLKAFYRSAILTAIEQHLKQTPAQTGDMRIKRLRLLASPAYRLRVGDYRVYYDIDEAEETVTILRVLPKKDSVAYLQTRGKEI